MCRMLGMIGSSPLPAQDVMNAFLPLCTEGGVEKGMKPGHLDGWGASGFKEGRAVYFARSTESADKSKAEYQEAIARVSKSESPVVIVHFRKTAGAPPVIYNTHPFHWRDWVFAHTGAIFGAAASLPLNETAPNGDTDSERFFLWIWEQVHATADPTAALAALLKKARGELVYSALDFLMSDGNILWAYRDFGDKRLGKGETLADREKYFSLYAAQAGQSAVICSEPLKTVAKEWTPLAPRTLMAFTAGKVSPQTIII
jgi:predicted glutamine amidotransferase